MGFGEGGGVGEGGRELFWIREGGCWEHNLSWGSQSGENGAEWGSGRAAVWGKGWGKLMRMLMNLWGAWSQTGVEWGVSGV